MNVVVKSVLNFLKENKLEGKRITVALSGGPDSSCLLSTLIKHHDGEICAAHVSHNIRDASETLKEDDFVQKITQYYGITLYEKKIAQGEIQKIAKEKGLGTEETARFIRYDFFDQILKKDGGYIALGHNRDDQEETILMRFFSGTSIHGLSGIPVTRGRIIRPLIDVHKTEILDYLQINNIPFVVDHTNEQSIYLRNKIRNQLMPQVKKIFPGFSTSVQSLLRHVQEVDNYIKKEAQRQITLTLVDNQVVIKTSEFYKADIVLRRQIIYDIFDRLLEGYVREFRLPSRFINQIIKNRELSSLPVLFKGHHLYTEINREEIIFRKLSDNSISGFLYEIKPVKKDVKKGNTVLKKKYIHSLDNIYYIAGKDIYFPLIKRILDTEDEILIEEKFKRIYPLLKKKGMKRSTSSVIVDRKGILGVLYQGSIVIKSRRLKTFKEDGDYSIAIKNNGELELDADER